MIYDPLKLALCIRSMQSSLAQQAKGGAGAPRSPGGSRVGSAARRRPTPASAGGRQGGVGGSNNFLQLVTDDSAGLRMCVDGQLCMPPVILVLLS